jgi:hypothetical protein
VAFSLSLSTESEITFVGGSLSVSAFEVTSPGMERLRKRKRERERERDRDGDVEKGRETPSLSLSLARARDTILALPTSPPTRTCLPDLM